MTWERCAPNKLYHILGIQPSADAAEIRRKYRQAALRIHPDKGGNAEDFHQLTFAFEVLSCPFARAAYDKNSGAVLHATSSCKVKKDKPVTSTRKAPSCTATVRSKRGAPTHAAEPPRKCRRIFRNDIPAATDLQERMARLGAPLSQLRDALQCMGADQRFAALKILTPRVQTALVTFMESFQKYPTATFRRPQCNSSQLDPKMPAASVIPATPSAAVKHTHGKYHAHMHVKALRFYTRGHAELEVALEHQMVLVQLRQALTAAGAKSLNFWEDSAKTYQLCLDILQANNTSEQHMGLAIYTYMRAGHWLPQKCTIISPVMILADAIELHSRLLRARRTSWEHLRKEWVMLMQCPHHPSAKRKSAREAERIADGARAAALKVQLSRAVLSTTRALDHEDKHAARRQHVQRRCQAKEERIAARLKNAAGVARRIHQERRKMMQRWWRRSDLTMDDIMHEGASRIEAAG